MDTHPSCDGGTDLIGIQDNALNLRRSNNIVRQSLDGRWMYISLIFLET